MSYGRRTAWRMSINGDEQKVFAARIHTALNRAIAVCLFTKKTIADKSGKLVIDYSQLTPLELRELNDQLAEEQEQRMRAYQQQMAAKAAAAYNQPALP